MASNLKRKFEAEFPVKTKATAMTHHNNTLVLFRTIKTGGCRRTLPSLKIINIITLK